MGPRGVLCICAGMALMLTGCAAVPLAGGVIETASVGKAIGSAKDALFGKKDPWLEEKEKARALADSLKEPVKASLVERDGKLERVDVTLGPKGFEKDSPLPAALVGLCKDLPGFSVTFEGGKTDQALLLKEAQGRCEIKTVKAVRGKMVFSRART